MVHCGWRISNVAINILCINGMFRIAWHFFCHLTPPNHLCKVTRSANDAMTSSAAYRCMECTHQWHRGNDVHRLIPSNSSPVIFTSQLYENMDANITFKTDYFCLFCPQNHRNCGGCLSKRMRQHAKHMTSRQYVFLRALWPVCMTGSICFAIVAFIPDRASQIVPDTRRSFPLPSATMTAYLTFIQTPKNRLYPCPAIYTFVTRNEIAL